MKKHYFFILILVMHLSINRGFAQGCSFDPMYSLFWQDTTVISDTSWHELQTHWVNIEVFSVIAGNTYEWSLCNSQLLPRIVVVKNDSITPLGTITNCNSGRPTCTFTSDFTGEVFVQVRSQMCETVMKYYPYENIRYRAYNCANIQSDRIATSPTTTICYGGFVPLTVSANPDEIIQWQKNGVDIPFANSTTYNAYESGLYNAIVSYPGTVCSVSSNTLTLTPAIAELTNEGQAAICSGQPEMLYATVPGSLSYLWMLNGSVIPGATQTSYSAYQPGLYTVFIGFQNCISYDTVSVKMGETPSNILINSLGATTFCQGQNVLLETSSVSAFNYRWILNGQFIPLSNYSYFYADSSGEYTVEATSMDGCSAISGTTISVNVIDCTGFEHVDSTGFELFPNPTSSNINIKLPQDQHAISIRVTDIQGREIKVTPIYLNTQFVQIPVAILANGTYIIQLLSDKINYSSRFVKTQ